MATKKTTTKRKPPQDKDLKELNRAIDALKGTQHNPIAWGAIIKFVAPIIGRLAARYAAGYLATKWNKRATPKIRKEVAEDTADKMANVLYKTLLK